jgi:DNA polymerase epsilon subunit 1
LLQQLIENLDRDLQYAIAVEGKLDIDSVTNYDEVKDAIEQKVFDIVQQDTLIFTLSSGYQMAY